MFYSVFESNFQVQAPRGGGGGGAIFGGAIEQKVFCVMSLGAYNWRGLYMYVEGLIFRIFTVYANSPGYGTDLPGLPRCKDLRTFSLFVPFVCLGFIVVDFFVFFVLHHR